MAHLFSLDVSRNHPHLESLLVDDRDGNERTDLPVYRDILMLLGGIAHELERVRAIEAEMQGVMDQTKMLR